jgi:hypothetical protein
MWSRVDGWESIVPGPFAAVFVEDYGYDASMLVRALEAEAQDEGLYMKVCAHRLLPVKHAICFTHYLFTFGFSATPLEVGGMVRVC